MSTAILATPPRSSRAGDFGRTLMLNARARPPRRPNLRAQPVLESLEGRQLLSLTKPTFEPPVGVKVALPTPIGSYLNSEFARLGHQLQDDVFANPIPMLGTGLAGVNSPALKAVENLGSEMVEGLTYGKVNWRNADSIQLALFKAFGPAGSNRLLDGNGNGKKDLGDIALTHDPVRDTHEFRLDLWGQFSGEPLGFSTGLPGLPLQVYDTTSVSTGGLYNFTLVIGVNDIDGNARPYIGSESNLKMWVGASAKGLKADGKLGTNHVVVTDNQAAPSYFSGTYDVGMASDQHGRLVLTKHELTARSKLNLKLNIHSSPTTTLPRMTTDLEVDWQFGKPNVWGGKATSGPGADTTKYPFGNRPAIAFNNVRLDLGQSLGKFASQLKSVTKPFEPVVKLFNTKVPIYSKFDSSMTFGKAIKKLGGGNYQGFADAIAVINSLDDGSGSLSLGLGSFSIATDARSRGPKKLTIPVRASTTYTSPTVVAGPLGKLKSLGARFPIAEDPRQTYALLVGQDAEIFRFDLPRIDVTIPFNAPIPVTPLITARLRGAIGFHAGFTIGFDTSGFKSGRPLDGVFAAQTVKNGSRLPILEIRGSAGLGLEAGIPYAVGVGARGGIDASVQFDLAGQGDRLRLSQVQGNPFKRSGRLSWSGRVYSYLGPFEHTFWKESGTLLKF